MNGNFSCPICGCAELDKWVDPGFKCRNCGHGYIPGVPVPEAYADNSFIKLYDHLPDSEAVKMVKRWEVIKRCAPDAKTLLDYGCGMNQFIISAPEDHGFDKLVAFDTNWRSGFCDERVLDEEYDILVAWHVFEHFMDPYRLLSRVKHKYLFLMVPWIEYVDDKALPNWPHFDHRMHFQFFTRKSMGILLKDYKILEENYDDGELSFPSHPEWIVTIAAERVRD